MSQAPHRLAAIGECMIELSPLDGRSFAMNFAGDTLNMAIYCVRCSDPTQVTVDYITALGDDHYSAAMLQQWQDEGVGTDLIRKIPSKLPGLYLIRNGIKGDREFCYYRSQAAARETLAGAVGDALCEELLNFNTIYLSGITLAILQESGREKLITVLRRAHEAGIAVCFDTNYRAQLWPNAAMAKKVIESVLECTRIALPSFEDATKLFGDKTPEHTAQRLRSIGVEEIVVKQGAAGYFLANHDGERYVAIQAVNGVIDTTAAGDSFNGAYLAARLHGVNPVVAAQRGAALAALVVTHKGAIVPPEAMQACDT